MMSILRHENFGFKGNYFFKSILKADVKYSISGIVLQNLVVFWKNYKSIFYKLQHKKMVQRYTS